VTVERIHARTNVLPKQQRDGMQPADQHNQHSDGTHEGPRFRKVYLFSAIAVVVFVALGVAAYMLQSYLMLGASLHSSDPFGGRTPSALGRASEAHVIFSGNVGAFELPPGNTVEAGSGSGKDRAILLRSIVRQARVAPSINTAYLPVPEALARTLSGQRIRVTIWVRRTAAEGESPFAMGYSAGTGGGTGWIVFNPSSEFSSFRLTYNMPARAETHSYGDRIAIWPDIAGSGKALEVRLLTLEIVK
jgi:hypothetical protein